MENKEFKVAWQDAAVIGTEFLEHEAARRAYHGTLKPQFYKGVECGYVREYSDLLMIFLLKARKPEMYREGVEDSMARGSLTLNVNIVNVGDAPPVVIPQNNQGAPVLQLEMVPSVVN